jgi:alkyl hydroperoxide reductase subunit AhpC
LREDHAQFERADVQILGISVDHIWAHKAYAKALGDLPFPLLADWDKSVTRSYGVLNEERGAARRSLFLIDYLGRIRWSNPLFDWNESTQYAALREAMLALPRIPKKRETGP